MKIRKAVWLRKQKEVPSTHLAPCPSSIEAAVAISPGRRSRPFRSGRGAERSASRCATRPPFGASTGPRRPSTPRPTPSTGPRLPPQQLLVVPRRSPSNNPPVTSVRALHPPPQIHRQSKNSELDQRHDDQRRDLHRTQRSRVPPCKSRLGARRASRSCSSSRRSTSFPRAPTSPCAAAAAAATMGAPSPRGPAVAARRPPPSRPRRPRLRLLLLLLSTTRPSSHGSLRARRLPRAPPRVRSRAAAVVLRTAAPRRGRRACGHGRTPREPTPASRLT